MSRPAVRSAARLTRCPKAGWARRPDVKAAARRLPSKWRSMKRWLHPEEGKPAAQKSQAPSPVAPAAHEADDRLGEWFPAPASSRFRRNPDNRRKSANTLSGRKLGEGGMGVVWLAHDPGLQRDVAVKVLPSKCAKDAVYLKRFLREARAAAKLNHPNTVTIYQVGTDASLVYLAMELVDGASLDKAVETRPADGLARSNAGDSRRGRRTGRRPRDRPGAPRRQAGQSHADHGRRDQGRRFRARPRQAADTQLTQQGALARHAGLHGPRTVDGRGSRRPHGSVFPCLHLPLPFDRQAALRGGVDSRAGLSTSPRAVSRPAAIGARSAGGRVPRLGPRGAKRPGGPLPDGGRVDCGPGRTSGHVGRSVELRPDSRRIFRPEDEYDQAGEAAGQEGEPVEGSREKGIEAALVRAAWGAVQNGSFAYAPLAPCGREAGDERRAPAGDRRGRARGGPAPLGNHLLRNDRPRYDQDRAAATRRRRSR